MLLSKHQYKVLRRSRKIPDVYDELGKTEQEICDFLESENLLENNAGFIILTEKGRAVLDQRFKTSFITWISIFLSVLALLQPWLIKWFL